MWLDRCSAEVFGSDEAEEEKESMLLAGETNLMDHADFDDVSKLRDGVQIFIGRESGYDALGDCSVVTAPYEINGKLLGVLGVVGPKRMSYAQVIPVVDVTSKLLSAALNLRS